ncbi:MAG: SapC family protein [Pseudomonadota bacterium]
MTKVALFYSNTTPLSAESHGNWSLVPPTRFGFAAAANSVPLATPEFEKAARYYPIVFVPEGDAMRACAILGYTQEQNLFVDSDGRWDAEYIPAFVRRYPFVFATTEGRDALTLCVDDSYAGFNQEGDGEPLFLAGGGRSGYLEQTLTFLQQYQAELGRTAELAERLVKLEVLEEVQAQVSLETGQQLSLKGFSAVNRDRLRALSGDALRDLAADDWLELIYIHLFSLGNFAQLMDRLATRRAAPATAE